MSIWLNYSEDEKMVLLQQTAVARKISAEQAIEKDWWVTAILVALSKSSWADFLQFKGGTSLSKAWGLISRFSEDIDLTISRSFFDLPEETNQQRTKIRREAFHHIEEKLLPELDGILSSEGITGYKVELVTKNSSDMVTLVEVKYQSILPTKIDYILPVVKIEFSAMSLDEPFENREIATHYTPDLKDIWLCHLSKDNNHPELAYKTIDIRLFREGIRVGKDVNLTALKRTTPSEIFEFD